VVPTVGCRAVQVVGGAGWQGRSRRCVALPR